jgi:hypothetical protein
LLHQRVRRQLQIAYVEHVLQLDFVDVEIASDNPAIVYVDSDGSPSKHPAPLSRVRPAESTCAW